MKNSEYGRFCKAAGLDSSSKVSISRGRGGGRTVLDEQKLKEPLGQVRVGNLDSILGWKSWGVHGSTAMNEKLSADWGFDDGGLVLICSSTALLCSVREGVLRGCVLKDLLVDFHVCHLFFFAVPFECMHLYVYIYMEEET